MQMHKRVLILTVLFAIVASSTAAAAVSAQTSSPTTAAAVNAASVTAPSVTPLQMPIASSVPVVGGTSKQPTTLNLGVSSQSVKLGNKTQSIVCSLYAGLTYPLEYQTLTLWMKVGNGTWTKEATGNTSISAGGSVTWSMPSEKTAVTVQYKVTYAGTSTYAAAVSNVVGVKYENTKTKPYLTYMNAWTTYATVAHGKNAGFAVALANGGNMLSGKNVTVWVWTGTTWVADLTLKTDSYGSAGVPVISETAGSAYLLATFAGNSTYGPSVSNVVHLVWT